MKPVSFTDLRSSPIAGSWYPAHAEDLRDLLRTFLDQAPVPAYQGELLALVLPHAGLVYSGQCAAFALKALEGRHFTRVIILSPSHHHASHRLLSVAHEGFRTPLGTVSVDHEALHRLSDFLSEPALNPYPLRNDREHAIEMQLPFLQFLLPQGFRLVPLMLADQSALTSAKLAQALLGLRASYPPEERSLLIASSDLSHFYPASVARRLDNNVIRALQGLDSDALYRLDASSEGQACGYGALATVLQTCRALGAQEASISDYRHSGYVSGDNQSVVGYVSALITRPIQEAPHEA